MDKYNIISLTTDIDELKADMARWCMLPYEIRMRSIDDCRRLYNGMSVVDLYNHLREAILNNKDIMTVDPDNLVRESVATEYDKYDELLAQSKELQKSPYIVILDPDIKDIDELNNKYYSYYLLNDNNKQLSDTYSWKIWGRNIYSMYMTLAAEISFKEGETEADKSNIVKVDENYHPCFEQRRSLSNILECVSIVNDFYNEALFDNDVISMYKYKRNLISEDENTVSYMLESLVIGEEEICIDRKFNIEILPKAVPWFTVDESADLSDKIDTDRFYSKLKEELNKSESEEKALAYGWNPSVKVNPVSMEYARRRQAEFFDKVNIFNLKNLNISDKVSINLQDKLYPVFFIFGYDKENEFSIIPEYTKVGVAFKNNLSKVYTFDGVDNTFKGFKNDTIYNYNYIDIVVFYMDKESYLNLMENIANINNEKYMKINFNSIFTILSKTVNKLSPDNLKIIYSRYINLLLKITNIDNSSKVPTLNQFAKMNNRLNVFKVYSGNSTEFTRKTATNIIDKLKMLTDNNALNASVTESLTFESKELCDKLYPITCITKINEK